jgi:regulatory protein YycH of two-component signal transduction system YycFG
MAMVIVAMITTMINVIVVEDMVVAVAMAAESLKEIVPIRDLEPMKLVKYAARLITLH